MVVLTIVPSAVMLKGPSDIENESFGLASSPSLAVMGGYWQKCACMLIKVKHQSIGTYNLKNGTIRCIFTHSCSVDWVVKDRTFVVLSIDCDTNVCYALEKWERVT